MHTHTLSAEKEVMFAGAFFSGGNRLSMLNGCVATRNSTLAFIINNYFSPVLSVHLHSVDTSSQKF